MIMTNVYYNKITFQQNNKSQAIHDFFFRIFDTAPVFEVTMKTYITFFTGTQRGNSSKPLNIALLNVF